MDYGQKRNTADRLLNKFGGRIELVSLESNFNVDTSDYELTESSKETIGIFSKFTINDGNFGDGVLISDLKVILSAAVKPSNSDVIKRNGIDYKIINVIEVMPFNEVICYIAQARQ